VTANATSAGYLDISVPGLPKPQGSMKAFKMGDRVRMVHNNHGDLATWRAAVTGAAAEAWGSQPLLDEAVGLRLTFRLPRPASAPKKRIYPDRLPDLDKLVRAVLDSLTGVVITDDARVVSIEATKAYASGLPIGCTILLAALGGL
jgi:crossover junction endodeoxyribonuclease RusA